MKRERDMQRNAEYYLLMLEYLLLEMRNLEPAELPYAPKLAYMFHNVPALLSSHFDVQVGEEAYAVIQGRATALGLSQWLQVCDQWVQAMLIQRGANETGKDRLKA